MELTEEIDDMEPEKLSKEKADDLFYSMLNGKTVKDTVKTSRGDFIIKFPKQKDIERIGILAAQRHLGLPARSFDVDTENSIYKCSVLDVMVDVGPPWYESAKKKNENFSWRDMPDTDFIDEVFVKARSFRDKVQEQLRRTESPMGEESNSEGVQEAMGDNLFSGVASAPKGN
jgi:hypothetical protein